MDLGPELLDLLRRLKRDTPTSLNDLLKQAGVAKSTLHLRLERLVELDLVEHVARVGYTLNDRGVDMSSQHPPIAEAWPTLPLPAPVRELPAVHQAIIELALCAAAVRFHRVFDDALPAFLLYGPGLTLKTLTMRIVCVFAGGDPKRHVLRLFKETAATATMRRNPKGVAMVRGVAGVQVVGLDEFARATPDVRNACLIYVFGETEFPESDGSMLEVLATPIVALNPPENLAAADPQTVDLQKLTGFDGALRRRMILADLGRIEIPEALQGGGGKKLLKALVKTGPYKLPRPVFPNHVPDELVRQALLVIFDTPDRLRQTDVTMIAQLVAGATAYRLDKAAATRNVLKNVATCYETSGWLKPGWEQALANQLGRGVSGAAAPSATPAVRAPAPGPAPVPAGEQVDLREFTDWCVSKGRTALPATPKTVLAYVRALAEKKVALTAIERKLTAIDLAHARISSVSPCGDRRVRRGLEELRGRAVTAAPLLSADLSEILEEAPNTLRWHRNIALLLLGVSAALRPEELVTVRVEGLKFMPNSLTVAFVGPKGAMETVSIPMIESPLCAVNAVAQWITASELHAGSLFCRVLGGMDLGVQLSPEDVDFIVRDAVELIGKDRAGYDGRSLRESHIVARRAQLEVEMTDLDALRSEKPRPGT